jgi:phosphatidylglycerophosphatase A
MILKPKAVIFLATGAHVGRIPFAPGTFGSLVGLPFVFLFSKAGWPVASVLTLILILFSVRVAHRAEQQLEAKDPGCIVIDEIAGMCVTLLAIPLTLTTGIAGFFLFRIFDVIKPPPARQMEKILPGGWGVVMDDVVAGIMANIILRVGVILFANH